MGKSKRWTKIVIKTLRNQLDHFLLHHGPYHPRASLLAHLRDAKRKEEIVLAGLAGFATMIEERAQRSAETAEHFRTHPKVYGDSTPEMIERFAKLAKDDERAAKKLRVLAARVQEEGWIGPASQLEHVLRIAGCDRDEDGKFKVAGTIASFMGAGDEFVVGDDAMAFIDGEPVSIAGLFEGTSYRFPVKVF